jgi:hypothetical protein
MACKNSILMAIGINFGGFDSEFRKLLFVLGKLEYPAFDELENSINIPIRNENFVFKNDFMDENYHNDNLFLANKVLHLKNTAVNISVEIKLSNLKVLNCILL